QSLLSVAGLNASDDYANFLTKTLSGKRDKSPIVNVLTEGSRSARVGNVGDKKVPQLTRIAVNDKSMSADNIAVRKLPKTFVKKGWMLPVEDDNSDDILLSGVNSLARRVSTYATSDDIKLGKSPNAKGINIIAIGNNIQVHSQNNLFEAVTIVGNNTQVNSAGTTVIGGRSRAETLSSVALGADTVADRASGVSGYSPYKKANATGADAQWKSGYGAVSVGD
ncbi:hypothetical protein, partial [Bartonella sp. CL45QHWL]|uniref:hypothetical protein n=1 Tax=Bartonella sp. CL45QHWL TaxID=3243533 RepID=UPI0035CEB699